MTTHLSNQNYMPYTQIHRKNNLYFILFEIISLNIKLFKLFVSAADAGHGDMQR